MLTEARIIGTFTVLIAFAATWNAFGRSTALVGLLWLAAVTWVVRIQFLAVGDSDA